LIYEKDIKEVTKDERQDSKTLNFALQYGMGLGNTKRTQHRAAK
jgi:DNA polymerase I-like protein with 3'-5' exonuclease and polymerase domains